MKDAGGEGEERFGCGFGGECHTFIICGVDIVSRDIVDVQLLLTG
jgi:hypothetical protein